MLNVTAHSDEWSTFLDHKIHFLCHSMVSTLHPCFIKVAGLAATPIQNALTDFSLTTLVSCLMRPRTTRPQHSFTLHSLRDESPIQ